MVRRQECMGSGALDMTRREMEIIFNRLTPDDLATATLALQEVCAFLNEPKNMPKEIHEWDAVVISAMLIQYGRDTVPEAEIQIKTRESGVAAETWRFFKNRVVT